MKNLLFILTLLVALLSKESYSKMILTFPDSYIGATNDTVNISFKVNGTAACKTNIESTVSGQVGVLSAVWNATTKMITLKFISTKIQLSELYAKIAEAGYDNAELRAKQGMYDALPGECKYTRDAESE